MDTKDTSTEERLREQLCATVSEALAIRTERDELRENAKQSATGNAAAMRDVLEKIRHEYGWGRIGCRTCVSSEADVERVSDLFEKQIDAALSAPARNCDISRDTKETIERCLASLNVESSSASFDAGVCAAIGWMLAAPAEGGAE